MKRRKYKLNIINKVFFYITKKERMKKNKSKSNNNNNNNFNQESLFFVFLSVDHDYFEWYA